MINNSVAEINQATAQKQEASRTGRKYKNKIQFSSVKISKFG